jgi:hypothetical protein
MRSLLSSCSAARASSCPVAEKTVACASRGEAKSPVRAISASTRMSATRPVRGPLVESPRSVEVPDFCSYCCRRAKICAEGSRHAPSPMAPVANRAPSDESGKSGLSPPSCQLTKVSVTIRSFGTRYRSRRSCLPRLDGEGVRLGVTGLPRRSDQPRVVGALLREDDALLRDDDAPVVRGRRWPGLATGERMSSVARSSASPQSCSTARPNPRRRPNSEVHVVNALS